MSDKKIRISLDNNTGNPSFVDLKAVDNGDDTYSLASIAQNLATPPIDFYFAKAIGTPTTLFAVTAIDDTSITVVTDAAFSVGDYIGIFLSERSYFGEVLAKPGSNVLTLDTPMDYAFSVGSLVVPLTRDLGVDGSSSVQVFELKGPLVTGLRVDITRIMITMITDSAVDLSKFGDLAALTKGIVLRKTDGEVRNYWNAKTNLDLLNLAYDFSPFAATNPTQGVDGLGVRYTFAGPDKHGVAVRLESGDALQILVQDNLLLLGTATATFRAIGQGHIVSN